MAGRETTAICLHVYYEDGLDQFATFWAHLPADADVFVTCRPDIRDEVAARLSAFAPNAAIICYPNVGMDVVPFLMLCHDKQLYRYKTVLKLHTKNRKSDLRTDQGHVMLDGLIGSAALVHDVLKCFATDPETGLVGSAFQLRSANALMYGNRARIRNILDQLEIAAEDWPFLTGTMFWIAGHLLRDIAALAPDLAAQARAETTSRTGGDGTLAHTLERIFGALCTAAQATVYVTERQGPDTNTYLILPLAAHGPAQTRRFLELDSTYLLRRHVEASHWCQSIRDSGLFDADYYALQSAAYAIPGMDPLYHFVLYGDLFACDPGPGFSTTFYQLVRRDVVRERICSLAHYLHMGRRDGTPAVPTAEDWFTAAQQLGLFDAQWYSATYPDVPQSGMAPGAHYRRFGQMLGRAGSASFDPTRIPVLLRAHPPHMRTPETFLAQYYLDEEHLYSTLQRAGQNGDYDFARTRARQIENRYGPGRALNEARATFYTLSQNWARAKSEWGAFWDSLQTGRHTGRHTSSGIAFDRPSERLDGFQIVEPAQIRQIPSPDTGPEPGKICVYTTLFGDIDDLSPILNPVPGVDYLCFTDRPIDVAGWRTVQVLGETGDNNLNAKIFKIQPHRYLHDYTHSLYVDANTVVLGRLQELIDLCRAGGDFVMWQHPLRMDVYSEANTIVAHRRHSPGKILDQVACYAEDGLPSDTGMFEASFIWRRHSAPIMQDLMAQWWEHICRFSKRDQLSLAYLVWKTGIRPALLSPALGTSRDNVYFFKAPHKNGALPQPRRGLAAPPGKGTPRDIAFVYDPPHAGTGSTVMRGQQLSQIVAQSFGDSRSVHYTPDTDLKDQILILTKGFLKVTTPDQLEALARTNVLIADFVDEPPRLDLISIVDGLMASSLCGYRDYIRRFPQIPTFHVTHHVDTRLPKITPPPGNRLQTGYFGELVNTVLTPEIETRLTAHLVDTSKQNPDWITALPHYNFHYAVRRTRGIDGAKPFLKGFTAAHCGANIIIQKSAGDACFYLGADYPYLLQDDASPDDIVAALDAASASVGSAEWRYGREIMRDVAQRSSQSRVQQEFHALIAAF